jgi:hypothetical protein
MKKLATVKEIITSLLVAGLVIGAAALLVINFLVPLAK